MHVVRVRRLAQHQKRGCLVAVVIERQLQRGIPQRVGALETGAARDQLRRGRHVSVHAGRHQRRARVRPAAHVDAGAERDEDWDDGGAAFLRRDEERGLFRGVHRIHRTLPPTQHLYHSAPTLYCAISTLVNILGFTLNPEI